MSVGKKSDPKRLSDRRSLTDDNSTIQLRALCHIHFLAFWPETTHITFFSFSPHPSCLCLWIDLFSFLEHCFRFCRSLTSRPQNYNKFLGIIQRCLHYVCYCLRPVGDQPNQTFNSQLRSPEDIQARIKFTTQTILQERCVLKGSLIVWIRRYFIRQ